MSPLFTEPLLADTRTAETDSTVALMRLLDKLWRDRPEPRRPLLKVGVVLARLCGHDNYTPQLFDTVTDDKDGPNATDRAAATCWPGW